MSMGEQIKAMRQIRGLTQGELAVKVEMATITIQQYERGVRTPKIEALQKIAQALEMPIGTFLPSMGMTENFGFRVRETRKKQHLSMEQLGQKWEYPVLLSGGMSETKNIRSQIPSEDFRTHWV